MRVAFLQKIVRASLFFAIAATTAAPALAWTGPTAAPPNNNVSAPLNVSSTAQSKTGYLYINSPATTGYPFTVGGVASTWTSIFNWPPASAPANSYGILVGSSAAGYSEFQNASGYWAALADSSYSLYGNGNIYVTGSINSGSYVYGPNAFGGGFGQLVGGGCMNPNPYTGGCSCPGFAPNVEGLGSGNTGYGTENMYLCY